jgi:D-cysteine desulfhydrase
VAAGALPTPDEVWVAFGTGGTAAGIALGIAAAGLSTRVVCVRVSSPRYGTWQHLREAFDRTRDHLRAIDPSFPSVELNAERVTLLHDFAGRGYGIASRAGGRARLLARQAGLELDDTYTAKTLAALAALAAERKHRVIVFWNTYDARPLAPADSDGSALPTELRGYLR